MMEMVLNTKLDILARSVFGLVVTGRQLEPLSQEEREAIVMHETGHIRHHHTLKRMWPRSFAYCRKQELEADRYAAERGHAGGLIRFLSRLPDDCGPLHPKTSERIAALRSYCHGK